MLRFADRTEAGRQLANQLRALDLPRPVVFALPRGGVPVGAEIARALGAPLDVLLVRKIGAPGQPELALGAVAEPDMAHPVINEPVRAALAVSGAQLEQARQAEAREIQRRRALYGAGRRRIDPRGRTAIVVDDGLATGATARAALLALARAGASTRVLAVPVAPAEALPPLRREADQIICLIEAEHFPSVGAFYDDFHQLDDAEVLQILDAAGYGTT